MASRSPASSTRCRSSIRAPNASSSLVADDGEARHAGLPRAGRDLAGDLALQRLLVDPALADDHRARGAHARVEVQRAEHERGAGLERGAVLRPQPAAEAAGAAGHRLAARIARQRRGELVQPLGQPLDRRGVGALLRAEDLGRALERRAHVAQARRAARRAARRRPRSPRWRPARAVGGGAAAAGDEHDLGAGLDGRDDELAGPARRGRHRRRAPRARPAPARWPRAISTTAVPPSSSRA